jgi:hypothetical protein
MAGRVGAVILGARPAEPLLGTPAGERPGRRVVGGDAAVGAGGRDAPGGRLHDASVAVPLPDERVQRLLDPAAQPAEGFGQRAQPPIAIRRHGRRPVAVHDAVARAGGWPNRPCHTARHPPDKEEAENERENPE